MKIENRYFALAKNSLNPDGPYILGGVEMNEQMTYGFFSGMNWALAFSTEEQANETAIMLGYESTDFKVVKSENVHILPNGGALLDFDIIDAVIKKGQRIEDRENKADYEPILPQKRKRSFINLDFFKCKK